MGARGPQARTGAKINLRVGAGSALERVLEGRSITETIHKLADIVEGGPALMALLPPVVGLATIDDTPPGGINRDASQDFRIGTGRHTELVSKDALMDLVRSQYPAGLVPVGIDEGDDDDDDEVVTGGEEPTSDEEDLGYLA